MKRDYNILKSCLIVKIRKIEKKKWSSTNGIIMRNGQYNKLMITR